MKYSTQHMYENDMGFSCQSDSRIRNFYDSDSNFDSTRADSDSDSDSSVSQNDSIPIPASGDSDSNKPGFDSDAGSRIWFRFRLMQKGIKLDK